MKEKHLIIMRRKWRSIDDKIEEIKAIKKRAGISATVDVVYKRLTPKVTDKRIDEEWFNKKISPLAKGYTHVKFVFSERDGGKWGVKSLLRGSNYRDEDMLGEAYIKSDERSKIRFRDGSQREKFVKVFCHEDGHEYKKRGITKLDIHDYDYGTKINNIEGFYDDLLPDIMLRNAKRNILLEIIKRLYALLSAQKPKTLLHPVEDYKNAISQPYGTRNRTWYPKTGRHTGTDYATPVGTAVLAPWDGEVIATGYQSALGNYCYYKYTHNGQVYVERWLHLKYVPKQARYNRGNLVGHTGTTGANSPHFHQDIHLDEVRIDLLTSNNWDTKTVDPETHYG